MPFCYGAVTADFQLEKILKCIEIGKAEGAKFVTGGNRITANSLGEGLFIEPTVWAIRILDVTLSKKKFLVYSTVISYSKCLLQDQFLP